MLDISATEVSRRDLAAVIPDNYHPGADGDLGSAKTPSKLRKQVAAAVTSTPPTTPMIASVNLRTNVLDSMSILETLEVDTMTRIRGVHRRANEGNEETLKQLATFDNEFLYSTRVGFGVDRLVYENQLQLQLDWFSRFGTPISTPTADQWETPIGSLLTTLVPKSEWDAFRTNLRNSVTKSLFPFGDADIPDLLLSMNMFSRTDVLGATRNALQTLDQELEHLDQLIQEATEAFELAKSKGEFEAASQRADDLIGLKGKKFDLSLKRIGMLATGDVQSGGLLAKLEGILRAPAVAQAAKDKEALKIQALSDIATLESDRVVRTKNHERAIAAYNDRVAESNRQLKRNYQKQNAMWEEIEKLLGQIEVLGEESRGLVREHMQDTETEQKRRKEFAEYKESYASHHHLLDSLVANCDAAKAFIADVQEYLERGKAVIVETKAEEHLMALMKKERVLFAKLYSEFASHCGRCMERFAVRSIGLERLLLNLKFQQNQACAVDDTDLPTYARQIAAAESNTKILKKKREKLLQEFTRREEQFLEGWEKCLFDEPNAAPQETEPPSIDPLLEVKNLIASIRAAYVKELEELTQMDIEAANQTKAAAQALANSPSRQRQTPQKAVGDG